MMRDIKSVIQEIHRTKNKKKSPAQPKPSTHEHQCTSTSACDKPHGKSNFARKANVIRFLTESWEITSA